MEGLKFVSQLLGMIFMLAVISIMGVIPGVIMWWEKVLTPAYGLKGGNEVGAGQGLNIPVGWECAQMNADYILCRPIRGGGDEAPAAPADPGL